MYNKTQHNNNNNNNTQSHMFKPAYIFYAKSFIFDRGSRLDNPTKLHLKPKSLFNPTVLCTLQNTLTLRHNCIVTIIIHEECSQYKHDPTKTVHIVFRLSPIICDQFAVNQTFMKRKKKQLLVFRGFSAIL